MDGAGRDGTFVGRLRADQAAAPGKGLAFFAVGDNCLTGAYKLLTTCHAVFRLFAFEGVGVVGGVGRVVAG